MNTLLDLWGFGVGWLTTIAAFGLGIAVARAREWLYIRKQVRELGRELELLTRSG
jgi:hypothetical protein